MKSTRRIFLRGWMAGAIVACGWAGRAGAVEFDMSTISRSPPEAGASNTKVNPGSPSSRAAPPLDWTQAKRIYFPPDPPPLGAQMNFVTSRVRNYAPAELAAYVTEPFYAPLSTFLIDLSDATRRKHRPRIAAYAQNRDRLLTELRDLLATLHGVSADIRVQELTALAQRQAGALTGLENEAESIRQFLASKASWYDLREWRLGAGELRDRLPEHRFLEYELVRASAFYQEGLLPAQRRLLRESAMMMQDEMFAADETAPLVPAPPLVFCSPDLARLLPARHLPPAVAGLLEAFVAEKDALRQELTDAVIAADRNKFSSGRRRDIEKVAKAQAARLAALDDRAEAARREYAPDFARRRLARPRELPPAVQEKIDQYMTARNRLIRAFEARVDASRARLAVEMRGRTLAEYHEKAAAELHALDVAFSNEHAGEMRNLVQQLEQIYGLLVPIVEAEKLNATGGGPDGFLVEFLQRHHQEWAYYEYETAVFEPGLHPAQRRLLLGGAIRRLELPLPGAERQPAALPQTLFKVGES